MSAAGAERRKVVAIFFLAVASGLALATLGLRELQATSDSYERLLREHVSTALRVERLNMLSEKLGRLSRSYLLTPDPGFVDGIARTRDEFEGELAALREGLASEGASELLGRVKSAEARHEAAVDEALRMRRQGGVTRALVAALETDVGAARRDFDQALAALGAFEDRLLARRIGEAMGRARNGTRLLLAAIAAALVLVGALSWLLARTLAGLQRSRAELAASMARLEAANRDLDAFAGRIAHDLRNALAPAAVAAAALRRTLDARQIERSATRVEAAVRRADGLIDGLLAFARAGQPARQAAVAPLRQITGEVLDTFAHTRALVDASVTLDVDDLGVRCPPSLLYTVLANLVSNALKFVEGRPRREVRIKAARSGPLVELVVEDTGPGIPPEAAIHIFEPFYRAPDTRTPGSGIGLATVKRIVQAYEGRVTVDSRPGEGTRFTVRLPLVEEPLPLESPAAEPSPAVP